MKNSKSITAIAAMSIAIGAFGAGEAKALLIDNFNDGSIILSVNAGSNTDTQSSLTGVLGGVRQLDIPGGLPVSGGLFLDFAVNPGGLPNGELSYSTGSGTTGSAIATWNAGGAGFNAGAGADFTDGGLSEYFTFNITEIDSSSVNLIISVVDVSANAGSTTLTGVGIGVQQGAFTLAGFTGVDFSAITQVSLEVDGFGPGADLSIDQFETGGLVPEPSSALLGCTGLAALLLRRRR